MEAETDTPKPLVSFCLFAFNQEPFIREAVAGAFAQTYSPLEIILSDDCSTDRTYAIMEELASAYQGPHRVILSRTAINQGVAHHVNSVIPVSSGSWIVTAAGDDISFSDRVSRLMIAVADNPGVTALCSAYRNIDETGSQMEPDPDYQGRLGLVQIREIDLNARRFVFLGAAAAWKRELYSAFSPLHYDVIHEDLVLTFRALLCGSILALPDVLVCYRRWGGNNSAGADLRGKGLRQQVEAREQRSARWNSLLVAAYRQMLVDLKTPNGSQRNLSANEINRLNNELIQLIRNNTLRGEWWGYTFDQRLRVLASPSRKHQTDRKTFSWMLPRIFGLTFFAVMISMLTRVAKVKRLF